MCESLEDKFTWQRVLVWHVGARIALSQKLSANVHFIIMTRKILAVIAAIICSGLSGIAHSQTPAKPGVELFFKSPKIGSVVLSPSGKFLAITMLNKDGRYVLGIADTEKLGKVNIVAKHDEIIIFDPTWINDDRLYFSTRSLTDLADVRNDNTYAVNRDGTKQIELNEPVYGPLDDGTDDILVGKYSLTNADRSIRSVRLYRMNTFTQRTTELLNDLQPANVTGWLMDKDHEPRFAFAEIDDETIVHYRAPGQKEWVEVTRFKYSDTNAFKPAFIDGATGSVYVNKNDPDGFASLYRYEPIKREVAAQPFFQVKGYDIDATPILERTTRRLLGFNYESDAYGTFWLDEEMKAIQAAVDQNMPGTTNRLRCRGTTPKFVCIIIAFSDQQPGKYFLYRPDVQELALIGETRPEIVPEQMARVEFKHYKARDGMMIPVYVTIPAGKPSGPRPAVVMVHGGPSARGGHWRFDGENQFLASRGYVVIAPDFRGSTGYGDKFWKAGWEKWGLEMQDDLTDAANWAVEKGYADKNRIAIAGASYGGYATLMGLIKTPEVFRCGINWVGVTDIDLLFSVSWSDTSERAKRYGVQLLVGDRAKSQERFKATSPLYQHERLKKPLLMAYGTSDKRVPLVHGTKFRDAVTKHNPNVEWVAYDREGHGWRLEKNNVDWWTRVEKFLEQNMKP